MWNERGKKERGSEREREAGQASDGFSTFCIGTERSRHTACHTMCITALASGCATTFSTLQWNGTRIPRNIANKRTITKCPKMDSANRIVQHSLSKQYAVKKALIIIFCHVAVITLFSKS